MQTNEIDDLSSIFPRSDATDDSVILPSIGNSTAVMDNREKAHSNRQEAQLRDMYIRQMPTDLVRKSLLRSANSNGRSELYLGRPGGVDLDDLSLGSEDSSIPPPPPPLRTSKLKGAVSSTRNSIFRSKPSRDAWIIEQTDSIESVDATAWPRHWNKFNFCLRNTSENEFEDEVDHDGNPRRHSVRGLYNLRWRRLCLLGTAVLFVLAGIAGLSVGVTDKDNVRGSTNWAALDGSQQAPIFNSTEPSESTIVPTEDETCIDSIEVDRLCYNIVDLDTVPFSTFFTRCEPNAENWIGIFPADQDTSILSDPLLWLWTCNSQTLSDCNNEGTLTGALGIGGIIPTGFYRASFVDEDGSGPFTGAFSSNIFEVSEACVE